MKRWENKMHSGHRERLRKRFLISPDAMENHEILELLLTYSILNSVKIAEFLHLISDFLFTKYR